MVARRTNDDPVKDSTGEWNLNLTNPHPNLPHIVVELALTKPDGNVETTQNQQGIFNLGNLPPGDYTYQYAAVNTLNPSARGHTTNKEFTVPADPSEATTPPATSTSTTSAATTEDSTTAIPLGNLHGMFVEEPHSSTAASTEQLAIIVELDKEILQIIIDPVTENNIETRKISLQVHLLKLITRIETEEASLNELKSTYEHHGINETIKRIEITDVNLTNKHMNERFQIDKLPKLDKTDPQKIEALLKAHKEYSDSRKELIGKLKAQRDKSKELKTKLKTFEKKTLKKNLKTITELQEYSNKFKEEMSNTLQQLRAPDQTVEELNNIQANIGASIERNHYSKEYEALAKFEDHMNEVVTPLNNLSTEYEELDNITTAAVDITETLQVKYKKALASTSRELMAQLGTTDTTPESESSTTTSVSPTTTTTPGKRRLFQYLFGRS